VNAGCQVYDAFTAFIPIELKRHIGLYILQCLAPSPQVKYKFQNQAADPVNGNDLCHEVFEIMLRKGTSTSKFFAVQDPCQVVPNKTTHLNFKVDPFLSWIQSVSMEAWEMGEKL